MQSKYVKINTFIKVNFIMIKNMAMVIWSFLILNNIKYIMVNGWMGLLMVMEKKSIKTENSIKASLSLDLRMVLANFTIVKINSMDTKANSMMVTNMVKATKYSKMVINTQVHMSKINSMAKVNINGKMAPNTKEFSIKVKNMDKEY